MSLQMSNKEAVLALASALKDFRKDVEVREALAAKILKFISDEVEQRDIASMLFDPEFVPLGTSAEYALKSRARVYWHEEGTYAPRTQIKQKVFTVPTSLLSFNLSYQLAEIETGRVGTIADNMQLGADEFVGAINARAYNTLLGSIPTTAKNYATSVAGLTKSALDNAINYVEDISGGAKMIIGRRNVLSKILDFNSSGTAELGHYSDKMKDQIMNTGLITNYRGLPVIGLQQYRDGYGNNTIPDDSVLVVGKNVGKYVTSEEMKSLQQVDAETLTWLMHQYTRKGFAVFFAERSFRIRIT